MPDRVYTESPAHIHYRSIFLSDLHIGASGFKAAELLDFLKSVSCDYLYLNGDIFDIEYMRQGRTHWNDTTTKVLRRLLKMSTGGTQIVYTVGNHDEMLQQFAPLRLTPDIQLMERACHVMLDGSRALIIHGHQFDPVVRYARWLTYLGSWIYDRLLSLNNITWRIRRLFGFRHYWSLSAWAKRKAKSAVSFVDDFESAATALAQRDGYKLVITGHIHTPALRTDYTTGIVYGNCGDLVESISALAEDIYGQMHIVYFGHVVR